MARRRSAPARGASVSSRRNSRGHPLPASRCPVPDLETEPAVRSEEPRHADVPHGGDHGDAPDVADREQERERPRRVLGRVASSDLEQRGRLALVPRALHLLGLGEPAGGRVPRQDHGPHRRRRANRERGAQPGTRLGEIRCSGATPGSRCPRTTIARSLSDSGRGVSRAAASRSQRIVSRGWSRSRDGGTARVDRLLEHRAQRDRLLGAGHEQQQLTRAVERAQADGERRSGTPSSRRTRAAASSPRRRRQAHDADAGCDPRGRLVEGDVAVAAQAEDREVDRRAFHRRFVARGLGGEIGRGTVDRAQLVQCDAVERGAELCGEAPRVGRRRGRRTRRAGGPWRPRWGARRRAPSPAARRTSPPGVRPVGRSSRGDRRAAKPVRDQLGGQPPDALGVAEHERCWCTARHRDHRVPAGGVPNLRPP